MLIQRTTYSRIDCRSVNNPKLYKGFFEIFFSFFISFHESHDLGRGDTQIRKYGGTIDKSSKSSPVAEKMIVQMVKDKNIEGLNKLGKLFLTLSKCEAPNTEKTPALLLVIKIIEKLRDLGEKASWFQPLNPTEMKISGLKGDYSVAGALNFIDLEVGYEKKLPIALKKYRCSEI